MCLKVAQVTTPGPRCLFHLHVAFGIAARPLTERSIDSKRLNFMAIITEQGNNMKLFAAIIFALSFKSTIGFSETTEWTDPEGGLQWIHAGEGLTRSEAEARCKELGAFLPETASNSENNAVIWTPITKSLHRVLRNSPLKDLMATVRISGIPTGGNVPDDQGVSQPLYGKEVWTENRGSREVYGWLRDTYYKWCGNDCKYWPDQHEIAPVSHLGRMTPTDQKVYFYNELQVLNARFSVVCVRM